MLARYLHKGITWIDFESPSRHEVIDVAAEFSLDPFIAEELLAPSLRSHVEVRESYIYLILHFPALRHSHKHREQEIDFIVGRDFLITAHYETVDPLHKFHKVFEVGSALDSNLGDHAGHVFYQLVRRLYKSVEHEVEYMQRDLLHIEEHIFTDHQVAMVTTISRAARDLLNLRQTIEPHRDVWRSFVSDAAQFFGVDFREYVRALENEYFRVHNHIMRSTESLHELRETNNSLLTTRQNETMRVLTLMALLTFPLALFVAVLDVDTVQNPVTHLDHGFWYLLGAIATAGALMLWYFKHKKWL